MLKTGTREKQGDAYLRFISVKKGQLILVLSLLAIAISFNIFVNRAQALMVGSLPIYEQEDWEKKYYELKAEYDKLKADFDRLVNIIVPQVEALRSELDKLRSELPKMRSELEASRADYSALKPKYDSLKSEYDILVIAYDALQKKYVRDTSIIGGIIILAIVGGIGFGVYKFIKRRGKKRAVPRRFCLSCGRQLLEDTPFCPHCGKKLNKNREA